ncbi:MAG: CPBP family intramembrane metalloprotease [Caulobacter sp.]|nr:CPBP family intramembrane metalloprotease [Caulobacter sp.]
MPSVFERMGVPIDLGDRRFLHPGPLRWLRATAWMVGLFVLVALSGYVPLGFMEHYIVKGGPAELLVNAVAAVIALAIYVLMVWLAEGRRAGELAPRPAIGGVLAGFAIGVVVFATVMIVLIGTGLYSFSFIGPAPAWTGSALSVQSGVIEEIMARGVILRLTWRAFGPWVAFIFSAGLFGALHLGNDNSSVWAAVCIAVEAGILLGAFYALTGRLWVSFGLHAGWNFTQGYLFGAAVSGADFGAAIARSEARDGFPLWLTGGRFGPEASLPALVMCTTVGLLTLWAAWKAGRFASPTPAPATPA